MLRRGQHGRGIGGQVLGGGVAPGLSQTQSSRHRTPLSVGKIRPCWKMSFIIRFASVIITPKMEVL